MKNHAPQERTRQAHRVTMATEFLPGAATPPSLSFFPCFVGERSLVGLYFPLARPDIVWPLTLLRLPGLHVGFVTSSWGGEEAYDVTSHLKADWL